MFRFPYHSAFVDMIESLFTQSLSVMRWQDGTSIGLDLHVCMCAPPSEFFHVKWRSGVGCILYVWKLAT